MFPLVKPDRKCKYKVIINYFLMEISKKQKDWIKVNQGTLKELINIRKEQIKNEVMITGNEDRRKVLIEMFWDYEHIWLPLLEKRDQKKINQNEFV